METGDQAGEGHAGAEGWTIARGVVRALKGRHENLWYTVLKHSLYTDNPTQFGLCD